MSILDQAQPGAQDEIERLRAKRKEAAKILQADINQRVGEASLNGVISPDDYRRIKQEVTAEHPVIGVNVTPATNTEVAPQVQKIPDQQ